MAGYTNLPFRELIREKAGGLDWTVTELVNARSLMERRDEALKLSKTTVKDSPCFVQLFSGIIRETAEAARIVEAQGAAGVDINMGCPAPKVIKSGGGSALLADPEHAIRLVEAVVQAVKIPVTVKTRLGMTPDQIVAPKLAYAFQELGVQAVTIHGRTRSQGFSGNVDLDGSFYAETNRSRRTLHRTRRLLQPMALFTDSLRAHRKHTTAGNIF